jgi:hypothetical protein
MSRRDSQGRATRPAAGGAGEQLAHEAARLICEEAIIDYRQAKLKAAQRLGLSPRTAALPDNARVQQAVIEYQRLFGGRAYAEQLRSLRAVAVQAMRLLEPFQPRLVGAVVSGAITGAHRVQLHAFADKAEALDLFFEDRGIPYEQSEREYRYPDRRAESIPLLRFEAGEVGVDVAVFPPDDLRRAPLSPTDNGLMRRLDLGQAQALARIDVETILAG